MAEIILPEVIIREYLNSIERTRCRFRTLTRRHSGRNNGPSFADESLDGVDLIVAVAEPEDVIGRVYEVLKKRRPDGLVQGDNPEAYLHLTIAAESLKCLRDELTPLRRVAGMPLIPIEAAEEPEGDVGEPVLQAVIAKEEACNLLEAIDRLTENDREIIRSCFGLDCPKQTLATISKRRGVSLQAIAKRRDRALGLLRVMLLRHAF